MPLYIWYLVGYLCDLIPPLDSIRVFNGLGSKFLPSLYLNLHNSNSIMSSTLSSLCLLSSFKILDDLGWLQIDFMQVFCIL